MTSQQRAFTVGIIFTIVIISLEQTGLLLGSQQTRNCITFHELIWLMCGVFLAGRRACQEGIGTEKEEGVVCALTPTWPQEMEQKLKQLHSRQPGPGAEGSECKCTPPTWLFFAPCAYLSGSDHSEGASDLEDWGKYQTGTEGTVEARGGPGVLAWPEITGDTSDIHHAWSCPGVSGEDAKSQISS